MENTTLWTEFVKWADRGELSYVSPEFISGCSIVGSGAQQVMHVSLTAEFRADGMQAAVAAGAKLTSDYVDACMAELFDCVFPSAKNVSTQIVSRYPPYMSIIVAGEYTRDTMPALIERHANLAAFCDVFSELVKWWLGSFIPHAGIPQTLEPYLHLAATYAMDPPNRKNPLQKTHPLHVRFHTKLDYPHAPYNTLTELLDAAFRVSNDPICNVTYRLDTEGLTDVYVDVHFKAARLQDMLVCAVKYISDVEDANRHGALSPDDPGSLL